jgi:hypothetical protein
MDDVKLKLVKHIFLKKTLKNISFQVYQMELQTLFEMEEKAVSEFELSCRLLCSRFPNQTCRLPAGPSCSVICRFFMVVAKGEKTCTHWDYGIVDQVLLAVRSLELEVGLLRLKLSVRKSSTAQVRPQSTYVCRVQSSV